MYIYICIKTDAQIYTYDIHVVWEYACLYLNVCVSYDQEIKLHLFYNVKYTSDFSLDLSLEWLSQAKPLNLYSYNDFKNDH